MCIYNATNFLLIFMFLLEAAKFIGAGLATISLAGAGIGIGIVFSALLNSVVL